jgi:amino acid adenylation domain-containing protein
MTTQMFAPAPFADRLQRETAPRMVERHAISNPHAPALLDGGRVLSYGQLDGRASRIAAYLRSLGAGPGTRVGICLPRSFDLAAAALGAWKAGAAYIPMDPSYPPERLAFMLDDAQAPLVVTTPAIARGLPATGAEIVDPSSPDIAARAGEAVSAASLENDLAYVVYTSGSSGAPKGIEITHGALANLIAWHLDAFAVTGEDRASHLAGLGFDASIWELWPYLAAGASVCLADEAVRAAPESLRDWMIERRITIGFVPTPLAEPMLALAWPRRTALRIMLTGGDVLNRAAPPDVPFTLVNNYGPAECAVVATSGRVESRPGAPPIGRPAANAEIYLLNGNLERVPAGEPGEICIGGPGLARGYHNRPGLTARNFVRNPFSADPASRLYRTGDLARLLPDGQFAFLGRVDDQIKIRGFRIEPAEIASALGRHPAIEASVVIAREVPAGEKRLVAYVVVKPGAEPAPAALRAFLADFLPDYMLPAAFVRMDALPVTSSGKIDRSALPEPAPANALDAPPPAAAPPAPAESPRPNWGRAARRQGAGS